MVSTTTFALGRVRVTWRMVSMALVRGIVRSNSTTSGLASLVLRIASRPSPASATTSMSGWLLMSRRSPERSTAWSSATRTRSLPFIATRGWRRAAGGAPRPGAPAAAS